MTKPNILLITADQWRGDCMSSLNHPVVKTPNLDQIASEGMYFKRHFSNAVPCGPSRASLHTGMYLHNHRSGTNGTPLDRRFTNWALELRSAGYDPALFGYTHTAQDPRDIDPNDKRLNTDEGILPGITPVIDMATHCPDWRNYLRDQGYDLPEFDGATYGLKGEPQKDVPTPTLFSVEQSDTAFLTRSTMSYIGAQDGPWAVHLSLRAPHPPWVAPEPYNQMYDAKSLPDAVRAPDVEAEQQQHPWLAAHLSVARNRSHSVPDRHRNLQASYYGLMSEVDAQMGLLVEFLKSSGQWQNTYFVFTSDHGEQMGDHWMYGKAGYFDQSYHIPLFICGPKVQSGVCDEFTEHVDWLPTCLDLLGLETNRQCDGMSLRPFLAGSKPSTWRDAACYEYDFRHSPAESTLEVDMEAACLNVVRDGAFKYVHFADLPCLLFDLKADPSELNNIASERPEVVARYAQKLLNWRLSTTDKTLSHLQIVRDEGLLDKLGETNLSQTGS